MSNCEQLISELQNYRDSFVVPALAELKRQPTPRSADVVAGILAYSDFLHFLNEKIARFATGENLNLGSIWPSFKI